MTFRIEEKLSINKSQLLDFKDFLFKEKKARELFPSREIESLYFDNENKEMYKDSIEGIVPRKKIRVRYYPNSKDLSLHLEMKISSVEGRYKTRKIINADGFSKVKKLGIFDNQYGSCRPLIYVTYKREYYKFDDVRISIDENIKYKLFTGKLLGRDNNPVVEIKTSINKSADNLLKVFPFQRTRFSKYCNGLEKIN